MAHGLVPAPTGERRLVAVFASPVAVQLVHLAAHVGFDCVVLDPEQDQDGVRTVRSAEEAGIDDCTDVVVTDHDRPELGRRARGGARDARPGGSA
jgi:xanthine/CO dehydrogenase XdhC/CoxF family maturation factor